MLARLEEHLCCRCPRSNEIAYRFMRGVGDPYRSERASAVQFGQQHIRAIGKGAQLPNLPRTTTLGHRHRDRRLVHIQSNVRDRLHSAPVSHA